MGQAKARGTREERIAQAEDRAREARLRKEMDERALARMDAANKRQLRVERKPGDVVLITHSSHDRYRASRPSSRATQLLVAGLAASFLGRSPRY